MADRGGCLSPPSTSPGYATASASFSIILFMSFLERNFIMHLEGEDTSLEIKPIKMFSFDRKISI
jgi:hypothetical protein